MVHCQKSCKAPGASLVGSNYFQWILNPKFSNMNSAFDDTILGTEIDLIKEKLCFKRTDIHLIMKIRPFSQGWALRNSGSPPHYSWKYVLIPKQIFIWCFTYDSVERSILKQSNLPYWKRKRNGREKGRAALKSNQITSDLRSCSKWKVSLFFSPKTSWVLLGQEDLNRIWKLW